MSGPNGENGAIRQEPDLAQVGCARAMHSVKILKFAQAFKELARGEQTADALEKNLNSLEQKIEEMLKKAEEHEQKLNAKQSSDSSPSTGSNDTS